MSLDYKWFWYFREPLKKTFSLQFRKFDHEFQTFVGDLHELPVRFPPSYPYSEDLARGNQFMGTRCPSWCDRIFTSPTGMKAVKDSPVEAVYNSLSPDGCVGDHKPVFLAFTLRVNEEGDAFSGLADLRALLARCLCSS